MHGQLRKLCDFADNDQLYTGGKVVARHLAGLRGEQWLFNGSKEMRFV